MASLIKNQILKHLSKFTKNLSTDKINVSTLRGEGALTNLELNEEVLMDLLELPLWIRLTKATCNRVSCKIQWTKLKSVPIGLYLDEVLVEMETCEELRKQSSQEARPSYSSGTKYGFSDKVIDGMTVTVNNVVINFKSKAFHASVQLSRIVLESRTPNWQKSELYMTRLKEPERGELLIFKQVEWQTLRVEAMAVELEDRFSTPLRLITNQARCCITIKKKLSDCSVLGSRLVLILDDLLWVLTDSQLKAALHFANSLSGLIQKATELSQKTKAARKLESLPGYLNEAQLSQQRHHQQQNRPHTSTITKVFSVYDVLETSYHIYSGRIELHLCDEVSSKGHHSQHPQLVEGGAMQITLANLAVDYYPYHLASGDRKHWLRYKESSSARNSWVSVLLADFKQKLNDVIQGEASPRTHPPVHRAPPHIPPQESRRGPASGSGSHDKKVLNAYLARLMSMCLVLRLEDITVFCVSTTSAKKGSQPPKFLSSDKGRLLLPSDMAAVHLEITEYYYPGDSDIPVPTPNVFCQLNPLQLTVDPATLLWINAFVLNLQKSQALLQPYRPSKKAVMDIRLEALMPRFIFPEDKEHHNQPDRPRQLHAQASRLVITNIRLGDQCGRMELGKCLETLQQGELFFCSTFPSESTDFYPVIEAFVRQSLNKEKKTDGDKSEDDTDISQRSTKLQEPVEFVKDFKKKFQKDLFWTDNKNIWCIHMDPFWIDFSNTESNKNRPVPFVDAFPLTLWVYQKPDSKLPSKSGSKSVEPSVCNGDVFCLPTSPSGDQLAKKTLKDHPFEVDSSRDQSRANNNLTDEEETVSKSSVRPGVADLHILAHVQSLVNVQVNHYQYLFLLRSLETMTSFSKLLAEDTSRILDLPLNSTMCFAVLFPELDLSLIMPHLPSQPPENEETESLNGGNSIATDVLGTPDQPLYSLRSELGETDISAMHESLSDNQMLKELKSIEDDSRRGSITKSISDSLLENNSTHQESPEPSPVVRSQEVLPIGINDVNFTKHTNGSSVASQGSESHSQKSTSVLASHATYIPDKGSLDRMPDNLARTFVSGSNVMKKGFTNLMSSIDSAFSSGKSSVTGSERRITSPEDLQTLEDWETMSIRSDLSSDSDQFLMVHLENQLNPTEETLFPRGETNTKVEVASEVKEDSPSDPSSGSVKRLDLISVVTFRLGRVEFIQQSQGLDSVIRAQCCRLSTEEHGSMTWDEFQTKFSTRSRNWQEAFACLDLSPCSIKFRLTSGPSAETLCPTAGECGYLLGTIHGVSLSLLMSSLSGMMDLIEDEFIQKPMPLRCHFQSIKVHLQEDRPPTNVTSPGPIPVDFYIPEMMLSRAEDGVYHLEFGSLGLGDSVSQFLPHILPSSMKCVNTEMSIQADSEVGVSEPDGAARLDHPEGVGSWTSTLSGMSPLKTDTQTTEASSVLTPKKHIFNSQESLIEENEQLKLKIQVLSSVERENERLREQLASEQREAAFSVERLREAQEELRHLEEEKKSLLATLQLLQNELLASEHRQALIDQSASG